MAILFTKHNILRYSVVSCSKVIVSFNWQEKQISMTNYLGQPLKIVLLLFEIELLLFPY